MASKVCPVIPGPGAGCLPVGPGRMFREILAGAGLERRDLKVMGLASYQLLQPAIVVQAGVEPASSDVTIGCSTFKLQDEHGFTGTMPLEQHGCRICVAFPDTPRAHPASHSARFSYLATTQNVPKNRYRGTSGCLMTLPAA